MCWAVDCANIMENTSGDSWFSLENNLKYVYLNSKLDLTTFFFYLSKMTSNLPEIYLSTVRVKLRGRKSYSSKK